MLPLDSSFSLNNFLILRSDLVLYILIELLFKCVKILCLSVHILNIFIYTLVHIIETPSSKFKTTR